MEHKANYTIMQVHNCDDDGGVDQSLVMALMASHHCSHSVTE
jgi:hypothetical protein